MIRTLETGHHARGKDFHGGWSIMGDEFEANGSRGRIREDRERVEKASESKEGERAEGKREKLKRERLRIQRVRGGQRKWVKIREDRERIKKG